jgi:hypothetical protein
LTQKDAFFSAAFVKDKPPQISLDLSPQM